MMNNARMVRCMWNIRPENRLSAEDLRSGLKPKSLRQCLLDRRPQWFGHLEKMEESAWSSKYSTSKDSASFRRRPRKTLNEVIKSDLNRTEMLGSLL